MASSFARLPFWGPVSCFQLSVLLPRSSLFAACVLRGSHSCLACDISRLSAVTSSLTPKDEATSAETEESVDPPPEFLSQNKGMPRIPSEAHQPLEQQREALGPRRLGRYFTPTRAVDSHIQTYASRPVQELIERRCRTSILSNTHPAMADSADTLAAGGQDLDISKRARGDRLPTSKVMATFPLPEEIKDEIFSW